MPYQMTQARERDCRNAIRDLQEAELICKQGRDCGHDMAAVQAYIDYYKERLNAYLQHCGRKVLD